MICYNTISDSFEDIVGKSDVLKCAVRAVDSAKHYEIVEGTTFHIEDTVACGKEGIDATGAFWNCTSYLDSHSFTTAFHSLHSADYIEATTAASIFEQQCSFLADGGLLFDITNLLHVFLSYDDF